MIILRRFDPLSCSLKRVHVSMNMYACTLFNEQDKGPNLLSIITWSVLGKQNVQAKKVYCTHVVCCLHYNYLLSRITMLLYISVYHEFIKRAIASSTFPGVMFLFHKYWDFFSRSTYFKVWKPFKDKQGKIHNLVPYSVYFSNYIFLILLFLYTPIGRQKDFTFKRETKIAEPHKHPR